eukprot:CAMPEP_0182823724 /NCGR_PEP_ID=MMETSP0006_2-20121128/14906_1 /TAXON_ID=97485 /ORGANISM="Prymnesium parvum, Strain Texoma1" /LENGTH=208 /DNA_ID=CAMNT_0024950667 /DNA_START=435 /DNA_END=1061 /DNA_ORIENTATION=+
MRTWAALIVILLGAVMFVISNPSLYAIGGYLFAFANLASAAAYAVYVKFVINTIKPSTMDLVLYNNLLSLPLLLAFMWIDDITTIPKAFASISAEGWVWVGLSILVAASISFAGFGLQAAVTATTNTVCQHCSKMVSLVISVPIFHDAFTMTMAGGVAITFVGSGWYSYERTRSTTPPQPTGILKTEDSSLLDTQTTSCGKGFCIVCC